MLYPTALPKTFYARDTHTVARQLLGKVLVRQSGRRTLAVRITEVEAYVGEDDLACHASKGKTPRTEIMYGTAGYAYIYLIYGMYHCLNIVTENAGMPAAVLIRAGEPIKGIARMKQNRKTENIKNLTTGPGKLCDALEITRNENGTDVSRTSTLYVHDDNMRVADRLIVTTPRIGVTYAKKSARLPWRYMIKSSQFVSG